MKHLLKPYSQKTELTIESTLTFDSNKIFLHFKITGILKNYQFPKRDKFKRADELWKATCFELFLANSKIQSYYEINISPTLHWNIYRLAKYRAEPKELMVSNEPLIELREDKKHYEIDFELECKELDLAEFDQYNLAVILLNRENEREFWTVNPVGESPDFHVMNLLMERDIEVRLERSHHKG